MAPESYFDALANWAPYLIALMTLFAAAAIVRIVEEIDDVR